MTEIESSTLRILNVQGQTIGTGFLVSKTLAVTCAHVALAAGLDDGEARIRVQFTGQKQIIDVRVPDEFIDIERDVAILELASAPEGVRPLRLGLAAQCQPGSAFRSFGYATAADVQGIHANGKIDGYLPDHKLLQLQSPQADRGISGAPVLDEKRGVVVGMITKGHTELGRNQETIFATPAELIFEVCPELRPSETCPYLGLEAFSAESAQFFFGREALTEKLLGVLRGGCRFLAVFGPSGSGKSSVMRAGLLLTLAKGQLPGSQKWAQVTIRPANDPFAQMKALSLGLRDIDGYLRRRPGMERIVLFVDQFEELFTLCPDELRDGFVRDLAAALDNSRLILILSMRNDFYPAFQDKATPLAASTDKVVVDVPVTLERADLVAMIERPAAAVGLALEEGLTDAIIKDATTDGAARSATLPLLEFALTQLWEQRRDGLLTHDAYQSIGGVTGSLARWADDAYSNLSKTDQPLAESLLTALVHLGDEAQGLPDTRRRRALAEFGEPARRVIKHFADWRLLVTSGETVELVHDALVREWGRLQGWLKSDRDKLRLREGVSEAARQWETGGRDESLLNHRVARLELALAMSKNPLYILNDMEQVYLNACVRLRAKETKARDGLRKRILIGLTSGLVIALVLAGFAFFQMREAQNQAKVSRAGDLASQAMALRDKNFLHSLLLSVEAFNKIDNPQTHSVLLSDTQVNINLIGYKTVFNESLLGIALSSDGKTLASIECENFNDKEHCEHGVINLLDAASFKHPTRLLIDPSKMPTSIAFNPNGKVLAIGSNDGSIIFWNIASQRVIGQPLVGHKDSVYSLAFSSDGKTLASGGADNTIILWNINTFRSVGQSLDGHRSWVTGVAFSSDGKTLASSGGDGKLILWDIESQQPIRVLNDNLNYFACVAFSPDGRYLASGGYDGKIVLWDVNTGKPSQNPFAIESSAVLGLAFSPDGKSIFTGNYNGEILAWDVSNELWGGFLGESISMLENMSPDKKVIAIGQKDGSMVLQDLVSNQIVGKPFLGHTGLVYEIAFSHDGKFLAGAKDHTIIIWDVATGRRIGEPIIYSNVVTCIAFGVDGKVLASGSQDHTIVFWDIKSGHKIGEPIVLPAAVNSLASSLDGKLLASGSYDGTTALWDSLTHQQIGQSADWAIGPILAVEFSLDGKILYSQGPLSTSVGWRIDPEFLINNSCQRAGRNFTRAEWAQYFPDDVYHATCSQWPLEAESTPIPNSTP